MNFCANISRRCTLRGFSLVEVLVATAVSSILLVTLASSIHSATDVWTRHDRRVGMARESRAALDSLQRDLSNFFALPDDPSVVGDNLWPRFHLDRGADDLASMRLMFFTSSRLSGRERSEPDRGNLRLVAYAVGASADGGGRLTQKLFRLALSVEETQRRLSANLLSETPLISAADWSSIEAGAGGAEPVAYDVVRFAVHPLRALSTVVLRPTAVNGVGKETAPWPSNARPMGVDLTLRIASHRTASLLETADDWQGRGAVSNLLLGDPATPLDYTDDPEVVTSQVRVILP